jgi:hypothetical protein
MNEMRQEIVRLNIANFERLLEVETDEARARTLRSLLTEARSEAMFLREESALQRAEKDVAALQRDAQRLRMRAEEYRTIAEACRNDGARSTYFYLARSYEVLAERAARTATQDEDASKAG